MASRKVLPHGEGVPTSKSLDDGSTARLRGAKVYWYIEHRTEGPIRVSYSMGGWNWGDDNPVGDATRFSDRWYARGVMRSFLRHRTKKWASQFRLVRVTVRRK